MLVGLVGELADKQVVWGGSVSVGASLFGCEGSCTNTNARR